MKTTIHKKAASKTSQKQIRGKQSMMMGWTMFVAAVLVAAGLGIWGGWSLKQHSIAKQTQLLFVLKGNLTVDGQKLTITDNSVEWFTDRPSHKAGTMSPQTLINIWGTSKLYKNAPNAAFSAFGAVVELKNPVLVKSGSIQFDYKSVSGTLSNGTTADTSLFIDAFPTSVNDQITD